MAGYIPSLDEERHRAEFYRMWLAGTAAGFTHQKSLETMGPRASPGTEAVRRWLLDGVTRGRDLTQLVRSGGRRFDDFERALIPLGDESGTLEDVLRQLAEFNTRKHALTVRVRKKLAYPFFTLLAACFIAPLPLLIRGSTRAFLFAAFGGAFLVLLFSRTIVAALAARYGRKPPLARARMARALATAIAAGLSLPNAVRLAADASANDEIRRFVAAIDERRLGTTSVSASLADCPHLTPDFLAVIDTAERTGDFTVLLRLADLYDDGFR